MRGDEQNGKRDEKETRREEMRPIMLVVINVDNGIDSSR
jgi:hypothetical protein